MKNLLAAVLAVGMIAAINIPGRAHIEKPNLNDLQLAVLQAKQQAQEPADPAPALVAVKAGEVIEPGQSGPAVKKVKRMLHKLGYAVKAGECFDKDLEHQIGLFQIRQHLARASQPHLGKIGPVTLQALNKRVAFANYDPELGRALVQSARSSMSGGQGRCYAYVAHAIHKNTEPFLNGDHAYQAAELLSANKSFHELDLAGRSLQRLPIGAVVVWEKGNSRSGHISIADGEGNELSDHQSKQMLSHYGGGKARVFLPADADS